MPLARKSLDSSDVFILDLGLEVYQWNGKTCNKDEKFKAVQYLQTLKVSVYHTHMGPLTKNTSNRAHLCVSAPFIYTSIEDISLKDTWFLPMVILGGAFLTPPPPPPPPHPFLLMWYCVYLPCLLCCFFHP